MLFLVTKKQKERILDEYHARLIQVFTLSIVFLFVVFLGSLFPAYVTMKVDRQIVTDKLLPLQAAIEQSKSTVSASSSPDINNDISILSLDTNKRTVEIYYDIKKIYTEIPNVELISIQVDTLSKKIQVVARIDDKNTANTLVEKLKTTRYAGANLPYSVFSQGKNFMFGQTLTYE